MRELIQRDWRSHEKNVSPEREEIEAFFSKGGHPYSMTHSAITIQTSPDSLPSIPHWMGEVAAFAQILHQTRILTTIEERVRFARARMGTYELIDFVAILIGYALSGEPTLRAFYNPSDPFCQCVHGPFWAQAVTLALSSVALFGGTRSGQRGKLAHPVPGGSAGPQPVC
jgi:hypothetical protein